MPPQLGIGLGLGSFAVGSDDPLIFCSHCTKEFPNTPDGRTMRDVHRGTFFCRLKAQRKDKIASRTQPRSSTKDVHQFPFESRLQDKQGSSYNIVDKKAIETSEEKAQRKEQRRREMLEASLTQLEVRQSTKISSTKDTHQIASDSRFQDKQYSSHNIVDKKAIETSEEKARRKEQRRREMLEASLTQLEAREPTKTSSKRKQVLTSRDANLKTLARDVQRALAEPRKKDGHASKKIKLEEI